MNRQNNDNPKFIDTLVRYSPKYRFELWVAIQSEMRELGITGHRSFYKHLMRSFDAWKSRGIVFSNANGNTLVIEALKEDDIYGFLGAKKDSPTGPSRAIDDRKVAIIDAYFKASNSRRSITHGDETSLHSLLTSFESFFASPNDRISEPRVAEVASRFEGVFSQSPSLVLEQVAAFNDLSLPEMMTARRKLLIHAIRIFNLNPLPIGTFKNVYYGVQRISLPIHRDYFRPDQHGESAVESVQQSPAFLTRSTAVRVHTGIAIVSISPSSRHDLSLVCLMRDRTTLEPFLTCLSLGYPRGRNDELWDEHIRRVSSISKQIDKVPGHVASTPAKFSSDNALFETILDVNTGPFYRISNDLRGFYKSKYYSDIYYEKIIDLFDRLGEEY